jgi:CRISPR system Cascade subunit CasB
MSTFLERLRQRSNDRGLMASLRCALVDSKKHRAWPALSRIGVSITNEPDTLVAALFATHPEGADTGNLGTTCRAIEASRGENHSDSDKLTSTERRFQNLLAAEWGDELFHRVTRIILMAKSQGVRVNYEQLLVDLRQYRQWRDQVRTRWAAAYWAQDSAPIPEEDA